jgi:radical SAM superfamily enzyme YgiQ (UPF0313 family)
MSFSVILIVPYKHGKETYISSPHLGVGYLAAALQNNDFEVSILDAALDKLTPDETVARCAGFDLAGLTSFSCDYSGAKEIAQKIRSQFPEMPLVFGGSHFSAIPLETMRDIPELDFGVIGEGELALVELARKLEAGNTGPTELAKIDGLVFRRNGNPELASPKFPAPQELPSGPAWDLLEPDRYPLAPNGIFSRSTHVAPLLTSRGCPFACNFCACHLLSGRKVRRRALEEVIAEMDLLANRYGIREFNIMDSSFINTGSFARQFCETLIDSDRGYYWNITSGVRLGGLTPDLVRLLERAGCYSMAVGIESGSDSILKMMNKKLQVDTVRQQVGMIKRESNLRLTGFFIIGYPTEDESDIEKTIRLALELPLDRANFFNFLPLPGTRIYSELVEQGVLDKMDFDSLFIHEFPFQHPKLDPQRWRELIRNANLRFYCRPRILRGLAGEIKSFNQIKIIARRAAAILF